MKVLLHYKETEDESLHKTLKITLPKSWKNGPTSKLLDQFVESYNSSDQGSKTSLNASELHLAIRNRNNNQDENLIALASDAITIEVIEDREDVFICKGASRTLADIEDEKKEEAERKKALLANTVACVHFGCKNRFPKGGPYPECCYHAAPPVFHETAKFWSCCPQKKAYDWDDFQSIKGCKTGICTEVKDEAANQSKQFLGGCDLREAIGDQQKLKSIDDFNSAQASGSTAAPVLERLRTVFAEIGIESELFDQVVDGIKSKVGGDDSDKKGSNDILAAIAEELGQELKRAMKNIAAQQLRIK
jgi:broad-specificity NMP kinase